MAGLALTGPGTAAAHVEVSAAGAVAGAGPVTIEFTAEAESVTAGVVGTRTRLPAGVAPEGVSLAMAPDGWVLVRTADGFEVGGPALPVGVDAAFAVTVARLPDAGTEFAFPTLQRYADGREDAWIEPAVDAAPPPAMPAPVLTVAPAAPVPVEAAAPGPPGAAPADAGLATGWLAGYGVLAAAALAGGVWFWSARARRPA